MLTRSCLAAVPLDPGLPRSELPAQISARADRFRDATRALADLRRGAAVIVRESRSALAIAAVETVTAARLEDLREWSGHAPPLLLYPIGLARDDWQNSPNHPDGHPVVTARALAEQDLSLDRLRLLADPTRLPVPASTPRAVPPGAAGAVLLARLGHLLPVLVAAPLGPDAAGRARACGAVVADEADIAAFRAAASRLVKVGEARVPLREAGDARLVAFRNPDSGIEHIAVVIGTPGQDDAGAPAPLVRLHSECFTGDVLGSLRCDCGPQLNAALRRMSEEGSGVVLYLAQEGRGIGLLNKLRSYVLQDTGLDTLDANTALGFAADERDFSLAAAMLRELGVTRARLLTNNPAKLAALEAGGIAVERASLLIAPNGVNDAYLSTKTSRFGHLT